MSRAGKLIGWIVTALLCVLLFSMASADTVLPDPKCEVPSALRAGEPLEIAGVEWLDFAEYDCDYQRYSFTLYDSDENRYIASDSLYSYANRSGSAETDISMLRYDGLDAGNYLLKVTRATGSWTTGQSLRSEEIERPVTVTGSRPSAPAVAIVLNNQLKSKPNQIKVSAAGMTQVSEAGRKVDSTYWYNSSSVFTQIKNGEAICDFHNGYYDDNMSYVYRFRAFTEGRWSEFSDEVTLSWTTLGKLPAPTVDVPTTVRAGEEFTITSDTNSYERRLHYSLEKYDEETDTYLSYRSSEFGSGYTYNYGLDAGQYRFTFTARQTDYDESDGTVKYLTVTGERPSAPAVSLSANSIFEGEAITITIQGASDLELVEDRYFYPSRAYAAFNGRVIITTKDIPRWQNHFTFRAKADGCWTNEFYTEEITVKEDADHSFAEIVPHFDGLTAYAGKDFTFPVDLDPRTELFTAGIVYCVMDETGYDHDAFKVAYEMVLEVKDGKVTIPGDKIKLPGTYRINFSAYADDYGLGAGLDYQFLKVVDSAPSKAKVTVTPGTAAKKYDYAKVPVTVTASGATNAVIFVKDIYSDGGSYSIYDTVNDVKFSAGKAETTLAIYSTGKYEIIAMAYVNGHWTEWSDPASITIDDIDESENTEYALPSFNIISSPEYVVCGEPFTITWEACEGADEGYYVYYGGYGYSGEYGDNIEAEADVPASQTSVTLTVDPSEEQKLLIPYDISGGHIHIEASASDGGFNYTDKTLELVDNVTPTVRADKTSVGTGEDVTLTVSGLKANDLRIKVNGIYRGLMSFKTVDNSGSVSLSFPVEGTYSIQVAVRYKLDIYRENLWSKWSEPITIEVSGRPAAPTLKLPASTKEIAAEAFVGVECTYVVINDGCETIGDKAFANCPNLRVVTIPASVTTLSGNPFEGCGDDLIIVTPEGSTADAFAIRHGIPAERK